MPHIRMMPRRACFIRLALILALGSSAVLLGPLASVRSAAQEALTNESVIGMVKAGLGESIIIQKIRSSQRKFDTSTDALIKLKAAGVPDKVVEAMITGGAAPAEAATAAAASAEPRIAYVSAAGAKPLKAIRGEMETSVAPFSGSRQEIVLPAAKAEYRIADKQPEFATNLPAEQWVLVRLKPGKNDRNIPISRNSGFFAWEGATFRQGPDPKYRVALAPVPATDGSIRVKPTEPLGSGEYCLISVVKGQPNMLEVFDFGVD
jgi:hypothetical protein